jgi:hypothetical protein
MTVIDSRLVLVDRDSVDALAEALNALTDEEQSDQRTGAEDEQARAQLVDAAQALLDAVIPADRG